MLNLDQLLEAKDRKRALETAASPFVLGPVDCKLNLIGDLHGAKYWYQDICYRSQYSIQLGDIHNSPIVSEYFSGLNPDRHRYIHGNHDWLVEPLPPHYMGKFGLWHIEDLDLRIGFISGAYSVDRKRRMGLAKFDPYDAEDAAFITEMSQTDPVHENEELEYHELEEAIEFMCEEQPDVIVSHTAPLAIYDNLDLLPHYGVIKSRTNQALDVVLENCKPSLWAFGHFHQDKFFEHSNVTFACVNLRTMMPFI